MKRFILAIFSVCFCLGAWAQDNEEGEDAIGIWRADSAYEVSFATPYLIALEVRGHVKTIKEDKVEIEVYTMEFNEDGELTSFSDSGGELDISCFDGQLQLYAPGAFFINVEIDEEAQKVISRSEGFSQSVTSNYIYDSNGKLTSMKVTVGEEDKKPIVKKVKVLETDMHGNWTARMVGDQLYRREITYYDTILGD